MDSKDPTTPTVTHLETQAMIRTSHHIKVILNHPAPDSCLMRAAGVTQRGPAEDLPRKAQPKLLLPE